jgi:SAM-dependent methyltransferase
MTIFGKYADYYDVLYADKNYDAEAAYVSSILCRFMPGGSRLLDFGCGTGRHAMALCRLGYEVHGIDASQEMLAHANVRASRAGMAGKLSFDNADLRSYRAAEAFDAVLACFHVVNYQTTDSDLEEAFITAAQNTGPTGIFVFDSWFGPAVLAQRPEVRVKRCRTMDFELTRLAEPTLVVEDNMVSVKYTLWVHDLHSGVVTVFNEEHRVRYLFTPEVRRLCARAGLKLLHAEEWLSARPPGLETWGLCYVAGR